MSPIHYIHMKRIILTLALCITVAATYASDSLLVSRAVYFNVDQYNLSPTAQRQLDSMIQTIKDKGECSVSIYGSTDIDGTAGYNQQLSERRARAVQDYLLAHDVQAVKCVSRGLGRKGDELSKAENRRVDVELRFTYFTGVSDLFKSLSKDADQKFTIDPSSPNEIKCQNNTVINIPAGSLLLPNGEKPKGQVSLMVREAISTADILAQDLNSVSDGKMLETRGMVYINASSDGQQLKVNSSSPISVKIPGSNATENDFKLFYGARHGDQAMNWKVVADKSFNPAVKTVPIDLDRSMLSGMIFTYRVVPTAPKPSHTVPIPTMPYKPRQPTEVEEPQIGGLYKSSALERALNKRKIKAKNEDLYQKAQHRYELYIENQAKYETRMKDYEKAMQVYNEQMASFNAEGQKRLDEARAYFKRRYEYLATGSINAYIKRIETAPISNKTILTRFGDRWLYPNDEVHEQLKSMLGETYYHYYHYDDPKTEIRNFGENGWGLKREYNMPTFLVEGYSGIHDSLLHVTHLADTLAVLQERITQRCIELGLLDENKMDGYVAAVSDLGWINCDRFYETPKDQLVSVKIPETGDVKMYMVFTDIKSCLPIGRMGNEYISSLVPKNKTVRIVAMKVVEGKPQMAVSTVNTSSSNPLTLQYKTCSLSDIRVTFAAL